jgi:hypothetical protein
MIEMLVGAGIALFSLVVGVTIGRGETQSESD